MITRSRFTFVTLTLLLAGASLTTSAKVLWKGDFEAPDFSAWNARLHGDAIQLQHDCFSQGDTAARIDLTDDPSLLWNNNPALNRAELKYQPADGQTSEGKSTFFAFSYFLPDALPAAKHEFAYWETDKTWQQRFRFNLSKQGISFQASDADKPVWSFVRGSHPHQWHRLALHIHWSSDPQKGFVEVWVDGFHQGKTAMATLPEGRAAMFTQLGLLRDASPTPVSIFLDDAIEVDNLTELLEYNRATIGHGCTPSTTTRSTSFRWWRYAKNLF